MQQSGNKDSGGPSREAGQSVPGSPVNKCVRRAAACNASSAPGSLADVSLARRTERFLLTAADQKDGSRSDRLARVIHAKFEAGLLRPYNHVAGYTRLMKWMADK